MSKLHIFDDEKFKVSDTPDKSTLKVEFQGQIQTITHIKTHNEFVTEDQNHHANAEAALDHCCQSLLDSCNALQNLYDSLDDWPSSSAQSGSDS